MAEEKSVSTQHAKEDLRATSPIHKPAPICYESTLVRYLSVILCLMLTACDGDKETPAEQRRTTASPRPPPESEALLQAQRVEINRRKDLIDAARARDPELARLLDQYEAEKRDYHPPEPDPSPFSNPDPPPFSNPDLIARIAARFAEHSPDAGLIWAEHNKDEAWDAFIKALYDINPDAAFGNLDSREEFDKLLYLVALTRHVQGDDLQRLIGIVNDPKTFEEIHYLSFSLVPLAEEIVRRDADAGWQFVQIHLDHVRLPEYLRIVIGINRNEAFPVHLLNDVPPGPERVELVEEASKKLGTIPLTHLAAWLATQPLSADYPEAYQQLAVNPMAPEDVREKAAGWVKAVR